MLSFLSTLNRPLWLQHPVGSMQKGFGTHSPPSSVKFLGMSEVTETLIKNMVDTNVGGTTIMETVINESDCVTLLGTGFGRQVIGPTAGDLSSGSAGEFGEFLGFSPLGRASSCSSTTRPLRSVDRSDVIGGLVSLNDDFSDDSDDNTSYSPRLPSLHEDEMENENFRREIIRLHPLECEDDESTGKKNVSNQVEDNNKVMEIHENTVGEEQKRNSGEMECYLAIHGEEDNLACNKCGEEFKTYRTLEIHESRGHCIIAFLKEEELRITDDVSNLLDQTVCLQTGFGLIPQSSSYETCGRKNPRVLKKHQINHRKLDSSLGVVRRKPKVIIRDGFKLACKFCKKRFDKPSAIKRHERIHTGDRPYMCQECGKTFNQKQSLDCHSLTHTGQKQYACNFCHRRFAQRGTLRGHITRVHKVETGRVQCVQCQYCTYSFKRLGSLNAHVSIFHPEVGDEENLIYLARNSNEQNDVSQVPNRQRSKVYYWARGVVKRTFNIQSTENKESQETSRGKGAEHRILQSKEKKAIRSEITMDSKYGVELPDSEKCEYRSVSSGICVEMPVVDTREVHEQFTVLNPESLDDEKFEPDWDLGLYSNLDRGEEIVVDHTLFKKECSETKSNLTPEHSSY